MTLARVCHTPFGGSDKSQKPRSTSRNMHTQSSTDRRVGSQVTSGHARTKAMIHQFGAPSCAASRCQEEANPPPPSQGGANTR
eukprot:2033530-Prymnesium_polylepis.1